jgi:hypothetical protein
MHTRLLRFLATTLLLCGLGLLVSASVGAAPPPPKFWSPARCQRVMLARPLAPPSQVLCVGIGGPSFSRWTSGHRARLYSEFRVFTRYRQTNVRGVGLEPGVVRSFMLATRARPGFTRVVSSLGRPVRRLASGLLQGPPQATRNACNSWTLSLHRRPDRGPPYATEESDRLHGRVADAPEAERLELALLDRQIPRGLAGREVRSPLV